MKAIIGAKSPLGQFLSSLDKYDYIIDHSNVDLLRNKNFLEVVCTIADMPDPSSYNKEKDAHRFEALIDVLGDVKTERFTLISPMGVLNPPGTPGKAPIITENTPLHTGETTEDSFMAHRAVFEAFVNLRFGRVLTAHLPGNLFGDNISTGILKEILEKKDVSSHPADELHQYYNLKRLPGDLAKAWSLGFFSLNLASAPLTTMDMIRQFIPGHLLELNHSEEPLLSPLLQSSHSIYWLNKEGYLYGKSAMIKDMMPCVEAILGKPELHPESAVHADE